MFDPETGITLLIPVPVFEQMAYAMGDDLVADACISPKAVDLELPVAIAKHSPQAGNECENHYA